MKQGLDPQRHKPERMPSSQTHFQTLLFLLLQIFRIVSTPRVALQLHQR